MPAITGRVDTRGSLSAASAGSARVRMSTPHNSPAGVNAASSDFGGGDDLFETSGNVVMYSNGEKISAERENQNKACLTE